MHGATIKVIKARTLQEYKNTGKNQNLVGLLWLQIVKRLNVLS